MLVPPMSNATASGSPHAAATAAAARTPAAGPERSSRAGCSTASASGTSPPAEVITSTIPAAVDRRRSDGAHTERSAASATVVAMRSYSRNSGDTSWEQTTSTPRARRTSATARS